ncbi:MAG: hypothetical protein V4496_05455 [Pseudomonadota bacterium]
MPGLFSSILPSHLAQKFSDDWLSPELWGKYLVASIVLKESDEIKKNLLILSQLTSETAIRYQARFPMLFLAFPEKIQEALLADRNFISQLKSNLKNWSPFNRLQASIIEGILDKRIPLSDERTLCFDQYIPSIMAAIIQANPDDYSDSQNSYTMRPTIREDEDNQDRLFGSIYFFSSAEWDNFADQITVILNSQSRFEIKSKAIRALTLTASFIKNQNKMRLLVSALLKFMRDYAITINRDDVQGILNNINQLLDQVFPYLNDQLSSIIDWLKEILLLGYTHSVLAYLKTLLKHSQFKEAILNNAFFECALDQVVEAKDTYEVDTHSLDAIAIMQYLILSIKPTKGLIDYAVLINHLAPLIKCVSDDTPDDLKHNELALNLAIFELFSQLTFVLGKECGDLNQAISYKVERPGKISPFAIQFLSMSVNFSRDILNNHNLENIIDGLLEKCLSEGDYLTVIPIIRALLANTLFKKYFVKSALFDHLRSQMSAMAQDVIANEKIEEFEHLLEILKSSIPDMTQDAINHEMWIETFCLLLENLNYESSKNIIDLIFDIFNQIMPLLYSTKKLALFCELVNNISDSILDNLRNQTELFLKQLVTTLDEQDAPKLCRYALEALEEFEALPCDGDVEGVLSRRWLGFLALPRYAMQDFFEEQKLLQRLWQIVDNENNLYNTRLRALIILCLCLPLYIMNDPTQIQRIFAAAENNYPEFRRDVIPDILNALRASFDTPAFHSADVAELIEKHGFFHYLITLLNNTDRDEFICHEALNILQFLAYLKGDHFNKVMRANENLIYALIRQIIFSVDDDWFKTNLMVMDLLTLWITQGIDLQLHLTHCRAEFGESKKCNTLNLLQTVDRLNIIVAPHSVLSTANTSLLFGVSSSTKRAVEQFEAIDSDSKRNKISEKEDLLSPSR